MKTIKILLLILCSAFFLTLASAEEGQGKQGQNLPPMNIPGITPGSAAEKELQEKVQQAAKEIEAKCGQYKNDNEKFNQCVNSNAKEAANSMKDFLMKNIDPNAAAASVKDSQQKK